MSCIGNRESVSSIPQIPICFISEVKGLYFKQNEQFLNQTKFISIWGPETITMDVSRMIIRRNKHVTEHFDEEFFYILYQLRECLRRVSNSSLASTMMQFIQRANLTDYHGLWCVQKRQILLLFSVKPKQIRTMCLGDHTSHHD